MDSTPPTSPYASLALSYQSEDDSFPDLSHEALEKLQEPVVLGLMLIETLVNAIS